MSSSVYVKIPSSQSDVKLQIFNCTQSNVADITSLVKQILKGSKTSETLNQVHRSFAATDSTISNSINTFHKLSALATHLGYQEEAIEKSFKLTANVTEQLNSIKLIRPR